LDSDKGSVDVLDRQAWHVGGADALAELVGAPLADADSALQQIAGHPRDDGTELVRRSLSQQAGHRLDLRGARSGRLELFGDLDDLVQQHRRPILAVRGESPASHQDR